jgi:hypothetical protein
MRLDPFHRGRAKTMATAGRASGYFASSAIGYRLFTVTVALPLRDEMQRISFE